jgi:hypothetical protein
VSDGPVGVGTITAYRVRGDFNLTLDFQLCVVEYHAPTQMKLEATGDFVGTGEWKLREEDEGCAVTYIWNVAIRKSWMRWISLIPGSRHRLEQSHDRVMTEGGKNLAKILTMRAEDEQR